MRTRLSTLILRWLRVPAEPHAPHGDPASLRVFRAGNNFYKLRLCKWGLAQAGALLGILFWFGVFADLRVRVEEERTRNALNPPAATAAPSMAPDNASAPRRIEAGATEGSAPPAMTDGETPPARPRKKRQNFGPIEGFKVGQYATAAFLARLPRAALYVITFFEIAGFLLYLVQLPVTYLIARMDYELRWYMVTDRSLRIRYGIWKVAESTMSFANIQQVIVSQGPVQRLLGLADVKVQSAGGGSSKEHQKGGDDDMHMGLFHSVTNAPEIRDLIQLRLRRFRESGLGDPEEKSTLPSPGQPVAPGTSSPALLDAARELAAEARALRASLS